MSSSSFHHKSQEPTRQNSHHERQYTQSFPSRTIVHAKLEMTEPGDHDEQEADAVASTIVSGGKISRQISGGSGGSSGIAVSPQMESQLSRLQGGGRQMPDGLRSMMESGFGRDFSQVRLHTDPEAASMSSSIHAKAFTHGNDIYFNQGQFSPQSAEGQRLVAHELTHVVQGTGKVGRELNINTQEAEKAIDQEIDHYLLQAEKVQNALETHQQIDLEFRFVSFWSRLFGGEKDFSYKFLYKSLKNAVTDLNKAKKNRGIWPYESRAKAVYKHGMLIDIIDQRLEIYKNNVQHGAEISITNLYITKTVSFAVVAAIAGIYLPGFAASVLIGGATGLVDGVATEASKAYNGIESDHLKEIGKSTGKGLIAGAIGGGSGKAVEGLEKSAQIFFNSSVGVGYALTEDIATKDLPLEKQQTMMKDYEDFVILLSLAFDYGLYWHTRRKKFIWGAFTDELHKERKFILEYLNDYIKEYPDHIKLIEQNKLPVFIPKTDRDL